MPNRFIQPPKPGQPAQSATSASSGQPATPAIPTIKIPLADPRNERASRKRFLRDDIPELALANSLYVPSGRWPARGWILLRRGDYQKLNVYNTNFMLEIDDFENGPLTFQNLSIVQARNVSTGDANDPDPDCMMLVEITDLQGVLYNPWGAWPTTSEYNTVAPAYQPPNNYYALTINPNTNLPWTWDQMVGDIWGQMPLLGPYPHLPTTPTGTPEDFNFPGVSAWEALNRMLDLIGMTVSSDLTLPNPYAIVVIGADDPVFDALQAKFAGNLQDDQQWIDGGSGRIPGSVTVYFHRVNQYYGTEETVRQDNLQWQTSSDYSVTITGPAPFNASAGMGYLWSEFTVRFDINNIPLPADVATAAVIAQERVTQFYNRQYRGTLGYMRQVYAGTLPFTAGSEVDGVCWRQDNRQERMAWQTELIRGPQPPWPVVDRKET